MEKFSSEHALEHASLVSFSLAVPPPGRILRNDVYRTNCSCSDLRLKLEISSKEFLTNQLKAHLYYGLGLVLHGNLLAPLLQ